MRDRCQPCALMLAVLLGGCAAPEIQLQRRADAIPEAGRAYMIGTFATECKLAPYGCGAGFGSHTLNYRSADKSWDDRLVLGAFAFLQETKYDFNSADRGEQGIHFCVPLQPGNYGFYSFSFNGASVGGMSYTFRKDQQFNLPFQVRAGEIAYLGKLKLTHEYGKNFFGIEVAGPGLLLLSSAPDSGIPAALQKCPESVRKWPVRDASLKASDVATQLVRMGPAG